VLQTFCEGPINGGPSLAKFHEGPNPRRIDADMWHGLTSRSCAIFGLGVMFRAKQPRIKASCSRQWHILWQCLTVSHVR